MTKILILTIGISNIIFLFFLIKDLSINFYKVKKEKGSIMTYSIIAFSSMFFSTFGISDFAINTVIYRKLKYFPQRLIPATLNTEGTIPLFIMALVYINYVDCDPVTLILLVFSQTLGSLISPRFSMRASNEKIKMAMGIGLIVTAIFVFF